MEINSKFPANKANQKGTKVWTQPVISRDVDLEKIDEIISGILQIRPMEGSQKTNRYQGITGFGHGCPTRNEIKKYFKPPLDDCK